MIRTGTCSWAEKTLVKSGEFYPRGVRTAEGRLRYYAEHFSTVEVDSTYYAVPTTQVTTLWAERTPQNFIFHIKVYGALTGHQIDPKTLPPAIRDSLPAREMTQSRIYIKDRVLLKEITERFIFALGPIKNSGKLGILVFQFPPWFQHKTSHFDLMVKCKDDAKGLPIGIEFRHGSWLSPGRREEVFSFLREHDITYVAADEPQYGDLSTIPFAPYVTTDIAYFRLHGRNKQNWLRKGIETALRYDYVYSEGELNELARAVHDVAPKAKTTYVMFNNCYLASAIKNALRMKKMIEEGRSLN